MTQSGLNARKLRIILMLLMLLIAGIAGAGFVIIQKQLNDYAVTITRLNANAQSGDQSIQTLQQLQTKLNEEQSTIERTKSFVADSSTYNDRVINDLTRIAKESGVSITSFSFNSSGATSSQPTTTPGTVTPNATPAGGIGQKSVTVTIHSPLSYTSLMTFLQLIESNPLKMQPSSVSMTKEKGNNVTTNAFIIQVYTR